MPARPVLDAAPDALVIAPCRHIDAHSDEKITLADLARCAGLAESQASRLQRRFTAQVGVSPRDYQQACRQAVLKKSLRIDQRVTDAVREVGYGSDSRVYERSHVTLGMTPAQYARSACSLDISCATEKTILGSLLLAATDCGICSVQLGDDESSLRAELAREFPGATIHHMPADMHRHFSAWMQILHEMLAGNAVSAAGLPVDIRGTAFQQKVWKHLQTIPRGETRSYAEVAHAINAPGAARAVGSACGNNRIALIIPCHRVLRGDGGDGGYRWGLQRKQKLLAAERCATR